MLVDFQWDANEACYARQPTEGQRGQRRPRGSVRGAGRGNVRGTTRGSVRGSAKGSARGSATAGKTIDAVIQNREM